MRKFLTEVGLWATEVAFVLTRFLFIVAAVVAGNMVERYYFPSTFVLLPPSGWEVQAIEGGYMLSPPASPEGEHGEE